MSRRTWNNTAFTTSPGILSAAFSFVTTNIGTQPNLALANGLGGLTGGFSNTTSGVGNSGPTFVSSITKTSNNGEFLIALADGYRAVWYAGADLLGPVAGPNDGIWAQVTVPANQGQGHTTAITFLVTTMSTANVPFETTGRTVCVSLTLKDSGAGP